MKILPEHRPQNDMRRPIDSQKETIIPLWSPARSEHIRQCNIDAKTERGGWTKSNYYNVKTKRNEEQSNKYDPLQMIFVRRNPVSIWNDSPKKKKKKKKNKKKKTIINTKTHTT